MREFFMKKTLELAKNGEGFTSPNPLVASIVVKNGEIVGRGYHQYAGGPHAEKIALKEAGKKALDGDLYVNLEPCNHYGRTGPCTDMIIDYGIKNVYIAIKDPNPLVSGQGIKRLREAGLNVYYGFLEKEARKTNEVFLKYIEKKLPFVALKSAFSLDGKIATKTGQSQWISNELSREYGHQLRKKYDAILVGINTVIADNPRLTCRIENGKNPIRIVLDSNLRIPLDSFLLEDKSAQTIIASLKNNPPDKLEALRKKAEVIEVNEGERVDLGKLLEILAKKEISSLLVEGGSSVVGSFLREKLVDKVYFFQAPILIGDKDALNFFGGEGFSSLKDCLRLENLEYRKFADDLLITAYPKKGGS